MPEYVAFPLARQIEIGMVGQVEYGIFIGGRRILDAQSAPAQGVAHGRGERARETLLAILAYIGEFDSIRYLFGPPDHFVEAAGAAVKSVVAVVSWNGIRLPIKLEAAMSNTIRVAPDNASEMRGLRLVLLDRVATQHHVVDLSVSIGGAQGNDDPSISHDAGFDFAIGQRIDIDGSPFGGMSKRLLGDACLPLHICCQHKQNRENCIPAVSLVGKHSSSSLFFVCAKPRFCDGASWIHR